MHQVYLANQMVMKMRKPIAELKIEATFEGTPLGAAQNIFEQVICPITAQLLITDPKAASEFIYHIMGFGISQFSEFTCPEHFKRVLSEITERLGAKIEQEQNNLKH